MATPEIIVADTSALYALISDTDEFHESAVEMLAVAVEADVEFWTTSYALLETVALVHRRLGFERAMEILSYVDSHVRVFWVERSVHESALQQFVAERGASLSLVDWTITLCARLLSAGVFTFDSGFARQGLAVIPS